MAYLQQKRRLFRFAVVLMFLALNISFYLAWQNRHPHDLRLGIDDRSLRDILNTTLGFQKIFVIGLPARTDRRDAMSLSCAVSNLDINWRDGVKGEDVLEKALPPGDHKNVSPGGIGSWRSHMNVIREIVEQNLTSALILEDDVDWDVRLRPQLQTFALASRALLDPRISNLHGCPAPNNTSLPTSENANTAIDKDAKPCSIPLTPLLRPRRPAHTPYGDTWDILWLGHCGVKFASSSSPPTPHSPPQSLSQSPLAPRPNIHTRILVAPDPTVPAPQHLRPHPFAELDRIGHVYEPHTRVVHRPQGAVCSLAYAISQRGARRLLWEFGVGRLEKQYDIMMGEFCDAGIEGLPGRAGGGGEGGGGGDGWAERIRKGALMEGQGRWWEGSPGRETGGRGASNGGRNVCVTTQPPLFGHHYPAEGSSDIMGSAGGMRKVIETKYVRWSTRMNLERLVRGEKKLVDQWPDP